MNKHLVLITVYLLSVIAAYSYGRLAGKATQETKILKVYQQEVKKNANIDKQVNRMVEPSIDRALSRWMH